MIAIADSGWKQASALLAIANSPDWELLFPFDNVAGYLMLVVNFMVLVIY